MNRNFLALTSVLLTSLFLVSPSPAFAQETGEDLIPSSAMAALFLKPRDALMQPSMELVPREVITAYGKQELGFDPMDISTAMVLVDTVQDTDEPPGFAAVLQFESPPVLSQKVTRNMEKGELNGKTVYRAGDMPPMLLVLDDRTMIFGSEPFVRKMESATGANSELISLIRENNSPAHFKAFFVMEPVRGLINENLPPAERIPPPFQDFLKLPNLTKNVVAEIDFSENSYSLMKIGAVDAAAAGQIDNMMKKGLEMGKQMLLAEVANQTRNQSPAVQEAIEQYINRVAAYLQAHSWPKVEGSDLVFRQEGQAGVTSMATIGILTGLLLPAVQQVREAARRTSSMNNLRQISLAFLNYESAYRHLPGNIEAEDGTPLLSWRVAILPFMEESALYEQFHLDEPWDSEHNIQLLDQMPMIYRNPNVDLFNQTVYQGFSGPGTMFERGKMRIAEVTDGTSNTILCVESDPESAVEWSRPSDLPFDPEQPIRGVGNLRPAGFNAAFVDGSVQLISPSIDQRMLRLLIQRNDGGAIRYDDR